ncbi:MAG: lipid A biosynthesis acyltransferase [Gammaproteobacteria bacterium]|nr:MAG: lipid A biosynthesis acyltransferase [Gammaproteobacteria bacterium]
MWLLVWLPRPVQYWLGALFGKLLYRVAKRRRHITEVNIKLCYAELSPEQQQIMVKKVFEENAIGLIETAVSWFRDPAYSRKRLTVEGLEHLNQAKSLGRGVLLVGAHYTTLDMGGVLITDVSELDVMYMPNKNPFVDRLIKRSRERYCDRVIDRKNIRGVYKSLKDGHVFWYSPDQDYGKKSSVFAPFFGINAASVKFTTKFANINNSPVVILSHHRKPDNSGYIVRFSKALEGYPTGDDVADATLINQKLEAEIRKCPEQYMWVHRRFKTRPDGEQGFY